jgi:uncharacterized membrane protein
MSSGSTPTVTSKPSKRHHSTLPSNIVKENHTPVVLQEAEHRAASVQLRIADAITTFAGSMRFVYVHIIIFGVWIATGLFGLDKSPFELLTLIVSLEAIFLSTFVMIAQNRQASFAQAKADHDFVSQEKELMTNTELTKEIHRLTTELHARLMTDGNR